MANSKAINEKIQKTTKEIKQHLENIISASLQLKAIQSNYNTKKEEINRLLFTLKIEPIHLQEKISIREYLFQFVDN